MAALLGVLLILHTTNPASALSTTAVPGTTITVNSNGDGTKTGNCTLREAIEAANTNAKVDRCAAGSATERDAIHYSLGDEATIVLGSELPPITDTFGLHINGQKAKITISGNEQVRVFRVNSGAKLTLNHLKVAGGIANGNSGGGLMNTGTVKVRNTTFSNNSADFGGGIYNNAGGTLTVTNSTFSENSASIVGGGIANAVGPLTVTNSTFSGNSAAGAGGGIWNNAGGTLTVTNTIVANSTSGGNCLGDITDGGYNIDDGTSCGFSAANNSMPSTEPLLAAGLANNDGPTKTIALRDASPAINAIPQGTNGCGTEVTTDQRGVERPQGKGCEIGSFEKMVSH